MTGKNNDGRRIIIIMKYTSKSEKETQKIASDFAKQLKGGEVLCLMGDLGAGKTAFTKGLAKGLGVKNIITSPTFVLMKVYETREHKNIKILKQGKEKFSPPYQGGVRGGCRDLPPKQLVHIDAYRLTDGEALKQIGALEYFNDKNCVTVIEWADRVKNIWPSGAIKIKFKILEGDKREISL